MDETMNECMLLVMQWSCARPNCTYRVAQVHALRVLCNVQCTCSMNTCTWHVAQRHTHSNNIEKKCDDWGQGLAAHVLFICARAGTC